MFVCPGIASVGPAFGAPDASLELPENRKWVVIASSRSLNAAIGIARLYDQADPMGILPAERKVFQTIAARHKAALKVGVDALAALVGGTGPSPSQAQVERPRTPLAVAEPRVVSTASGRYAIVLGPVDLASIDLFHAGYDGRTPLPADAFLSNSDGYLAIIWQPSHPVLDAASFNDGKTGTLASGSFRVSIRTEPEPGKRLLSIDNVAAASPMVHISGGDQGGPRFDVAFSAPSGFSDDSNLARLVWLDHKAPHPQIVFQRRSGVDTSRSWIVTEISPGAWQMSYAGIQDATGLRFDDPDRDGNVRLIAQNPSFIGSILANASLTRSARIGPDAIPPNSGALGGLVAHFSAADFADAFGLPKVAPPQILRTEGKYFWDGSEDSAARTRLEQDLGGFEFRARLFNALWRSNEFLAGWTMTKILAGDGIDAWSRMLLLYDRSDDGSPVSYAALASGAGVTFPQRLALFLASLGYKLPPDLPDSKAMPLPAASAGQAAPTPAPTAPRLVQRGSAIFVADGKLVTFGRLVDGCGTIAIGRGRVAMPADHVVPAKVVARDTDNDLVLIDADLYAGQHPLFGDAAPLGAAVTGFGFPRDGILSSTGNFALAHVVRSVADDDEGFLQFTAPFWQGTQGGPLLDGTGQIVGLIAGGEAPDLPGGRFQRINYALTSDIVAGFLSSHEIAVRTKAKPLQLDPADIASAAVRLTARVYCDN